MSSYAEVFTMVKECCREQMPASPYGLWIKDIECIALDNTSAKLSVSTDLRKDIIEQRYLDLLVSSFEEVMGFPVVVSLVSEEAIASEKEEVSQIVPEPSPRTVLKKGDYEYNFGNFIVGSSNKFAHAASMAVAENPAAAYNPLFIHGGSGLGKTHLLCAICDEISKNYPNSTLLYIKSEEFTNDLISSLGKNSMAAFREKYRAADVLLIDDIQFIGGKTSTQEEFFHTFNTLYESDLRQR